MSCFEGTIQEREPIVTLDDDNVDKSSKIRLIGLLT
jgi:hypothetical protein